MSHRWRLIGIVVLGLAPFSHSAETKATQTYQVPYRLADTKHLIVRAKINDKGPFNFVIDTGAPAMFITQSLGKKLGISTDKNGWATFDRLEFEGGLILPKARGRIEDLFQLEGMNGMGLPGIELHGLLGFNILARFRIEYDLTQEKMKWTPLNYEPAMPERFGKGGAPAGLNAVGDILKVVGGLMGRTANSDAVPRGFLGIELAELDGVVKIKAVLDKSPAADAGLKSGDQIRRFQGKDIRRLSEIQESFAKLAEGVSVRLTRVRGDTEEEITIKAGKGL